MCRTVSSFMHYYCILYVLHAKRKSLNSTSLTISLSPSLSFFHTLSFSLSSRHLEIDTMDSKMGRLKFFSQAYLCICWVGGCVWGYTPSSFTKKPLFSLIHHSHLSSSTQDDGMIFGQMHISTHNLSLSSSG